MSHEIGKKRALVFPCGSEVGLEIHRSLSTDTHIELYGASSVVSNHGRFVFGHYRDGLPFITEPGFIDALNSVIRDQGIDFVFPAMDCVLLNLAENQERLACRVIGSPLETCRICCSKRATYELFSPILRVPSLYASLDDVPAWPIFLKPDSSYGGRGVHKVHSREDAEFFLRRDRSLLAMEYLPGREYTIDCFSDRHGNLLFAGARERLRIRDGLCVHSRPVAGAAFQELARTINATLRLRGVWFFQVKENAEGELALMEIAPRVAGSMALYRNLGVNFALLSVYDAMDMDVSVQVNDFQIEVDRAAGDRFRTDLSYGHVYVDLDDCLICDGLVNTSVVAFLYQCVNRGVGIHLLTRHRASVDETLGRARLRGLFDEVIHLQSGEPKSKAIRHADAIFIDDSFQERRDVHEGKGIPVFAPDAIECLMQSDRGPLQP